MPLAMHSIILSLLSTTAELSEKSDLGTSSGFPPGVTYGNPGRSHEHEIYYYFIFGT
jgi:hypothetical protein